MNTPIKKALDALALAKECGGELDLQYYSESHAALDHVVHAARAYDASLEAAEQPPTGEDYEHIMSLLGLRAVDSIDDPEVAIAAAIENVRQSDENVRRLADFLGFDDTVQTHAVPIETDVVDFTQSWIGGEDVAPAAATLDLHTGRIALVDHSLGHPLLVADGTCVIRYAGKECLRAGVFLSTVHEQLPRKRRDARHSCGGASHARRTRIQSRRPPLSADPAEILI